MATFHCADTDRLYPMAPISLDMGGEQQQQVNTASKLPQDLMSDLGYPDLEPSNFIKYLYSNMESIQALYAAENLPSGEDFPTISVSVET